MTCFVLCCVRGVVLCAVCCVVYCETACIRTHRLGRTTRATRMAGEDDEPVAGVEQLAVIVLVDAQLLAATCRDEGATQTADPPQRDHEPKRTLQVQ